MRAPLAPHGDGWIRQRDPRLRILATAAFALVTVSLDQLAGTIAALLLASGLALSAGIRLGELAKRMLALEGFMLILLISLPLSVPGPPALSIGVLSASQPGLHLAALILLKANAVVLALLALVGTMEPVALGHALARLGIPEKLAHLLLMTVRQIHVLHAEFIRLRQAMRARAFTPRSNRHTWRSYGWLMGMLLVRSLARSQRLLEAMRCRGFHGRLFLLDSTHWSRADTLVAIGLGLLLAIPPVLDALAP